MANILDDTRNLRGGPPRALNLFTQIRMLFGGFMVQFGSGIFWFGMIFVLAFVCQSELIYMFNFDGTWLETDAIIRNVGSTNAEVDGQDLYQFEFEYNVENQEFTGSSYGYMDNGVGVGATTRIEYRSGNPARSRILGMTTQMFSYWVGLVLIFPLVGFICMILGFRSNYKALELIKNGRFTSGTLLSKSPTSTQINNKTVMAYEFEFKANNRPFIAKCKTHEYHLVEDDELEKIVYMGDDPTRNIVYDAYSHAPKIDKFGKLIQSGLGGILYTWITVLGIIVNGLIYMLLF